MDKKIQRKLNKMDRQQLRSFVLERREVGDFDKLEQQAYALDLLIEEAGSEGFREGTAHVARMF